jgi:lipopolysaccharide transport system ATP-binding protein
MAVQGRLSALIEVTAGFHPDLTGRENIFLNGTILGMTKREIESKLDQIIAFSGIEEFIDTPVKRYSSGMNARLGFSVAAHVDPDVLIVDEVLSVGDYAFQQKCVARMKEVLRNGVAVLFVSHNLKTVAEFCDRCLLLRGGRTVAIGPPQEVISNYVHKTWNGRGMDTGASAVQITSVKVRGEQGDSMRFRSGQKAWVDVELTARMRCKKLSVSLYILDNNLTEVFDTSSDLLGHGNFDLEEGDVYRCTFEVSLNLADGTYSPCVLIYRRDVQTVFDRWEPAATIYVSSAEGVRGIAHCFPQVIRQEIRQAREASLVEIAEETSFQKRGASD